MKNFEALFNPRGIAIIGATPDTARAGGQTLQVLRERGYKGGIYPVNPKYEAIGSHTCYASIAKVPHPCDVAVVAVPAAHVPQMIADCGQHGVRYAVVLGGGFREAGEAGRALEARMLENARKHGVRLIGPNCLGLVNVHLQAYAAFGSITRAPFLERGGVSAVIQSGGFGNSLVLQCASAGIGFRYVVASGNEADITTPEILEAFVDDPETRVILAYIEGLNDGRAFLAAARRALTLGKPVVVWKAGNTRQGMKAAASHTANMAASYDIFRAAFRDAGVIEVGDMEEAADFVKTLLSQPPAAGKNAAVMGGSGGSAVAFSDAADGCGVTLARLAPETMAILKENLPNMASLDNPVDYTAGFITEQNKPKFERAVDAVLADPNIHQLGLLFATVTGTGGVGRRGAEALAAAAGRHAKPVYVFSSVPRETASEMFDILERANIPIMRSVNRVARAMSMLADYTQARQRAAAPADEQVPPAAVRLPDVAGALDEHDSKSVLRAYGVPVADDRLFPPAPIAAAEAAGLKYPVVLKVVSRDIAHKSDVGGVRLGIANADELAAASAAMLAAIRDRVPDAKVTGLLVSPLMRGGLETIVGIVNDAVFGPVVAFGMGGIHAEVLKDMTYRLAPFSIYTARTMISELRASALFAGVRGQPPRDVEALAQALVSVSHMAWAMRDRLAELDVNPLLVMPKGEGVVAVDALAVLR
ncbi:MAG: acetate--CoA ligase family protein [Rhodospirillaceae bacterium]